MKIAATEISRVQEILERKEAELVRVLRERGGIAIERSADPMDEIQSASERDLAIGNVDRESTLLREVRAALRRQHDGSFGTCVECESEISAKRLAPCRGHHVVSSARRLPIEMDGREKLHGARLSRRSPECSFRGQRRQLQGQGFRRLTRPHCKTQLLSPAACAFERGDEGESAAELATQSVLGTDLPLSPAVNPSALDG